MGFLKLFRKGDTREEGAGTCHNPPATYLRGHFPVWPSVTVFQFYIGLIVNSVQILVETIQEKSQELLRVLLLEAVEPGGVFSDRPLQNEANTTKAVMLPHPPPLNPR